MITPKLQNKGPKRQSEEERSRRRRNKWAQKRKNRKSLESDPCTWEASGGLIMASGVVPTPREPHFCIILLIFLQNYAKKGGLSPSCNCRTALHCVIVIFLRICFSFFCKITPKLQNKDPKKGALLNRRRGQKEGGGRCSSLC